MDRRLELVQTATLDVPALKSKQACRRLSTSIPTSLSSVEQYKKEGDYEREKRAVRRGSSADELGRPRKVIKKGAQSYLHECDSDGHRLLHSPPSGKVSIKSSSTPS